MTTKDVVDSAAEVLALIERGEYTTRGGERHVIRDAVKAAIDGTVLYRPEALDALLASSSSEARFATRIEVTGETTQAAAHRLVSAGASNLVLLNFASARNPGGGFLRGARAQEEDLARASALYPCLLTQRDYYAANRAADSLLYTDHVIYSPAVPFFRATQGLIAPFEASVVTSPAPNAGEVLRRDAAATDAIDRVFRRRAGHVLAICAERGHSHVLLGAWGCGAFRNDPVLAADAFATWLESPRFRGVFESVVFAVYARAHEEANRRAFESRFSPSTR